MDLRALVAGPVRFKRTGRSGFIIGPQGVSGLDGVDMRLDQVVVPGQNGSFAFPGYLASRAVSISGTCFAESPQHLRALGEDFTGLYADGEVGKLVVEYDQKYRLGVQRAAKPQFVPFGLDTMQARFQLNLWAPDPLMYSSEERKFGPVADGVALPIFTRGNTGTAPRFRIQHTGGSPTSYTIHNGSLSYTVTAPLPGHTHDVDMATGDLLVDGVPVLGGRTSSTTWDIEPGAPQGHSITAVGGSVILEATLRDAIA